MEHRSLNLISVLDFFNRIDELEIHDELPKFSDIDAGSFYFFLNKDSVSDQHDLTHDQFSPWTGSVGGKRKTTKTEKFFLTSDNGVFSISSSVTDLILKVIKNNHHNLPHFSREIYYIIHEGTVGSHVLYVYTSTIDFAFIEPVRGYKKLLPSQVKTIKSAMCKRTTAAADEYLAVHGLHYSKKTISSISRSVIDHHKTKKGRNAPLDYHSIIDRYVASVNPEEVLSQPSIEKLPSGKVKVRKLVGFPTAVDCFASSLPTPEQLASFRSEIELIEHMNRNDAEEQLKSHLSILNESGSVPTIGNSIMIDTTFSLTTAEYVTLVLGISDTFKSKTSHKNASLLLGYMIHSSKEAEEHEIFSSFLNDLFKKFRDKKQIGLIIHDGEISFHAYNTGFFFKDARVLRCDVHRSENVKELCRGEDLDYDSVKNSLWGSRLQIGCARVLKRGILNSLSFREYSQEMNQFIDTLSEGKMKNWLRHNFNSLFENNSMFSKLIAGWPVQYVTTNIIESKNAEVKTIVDRKMPAHRILDCFLKLHKDEIMESKRGIVGEMSKLVPIEWYSIDEWAKKSLAERKFVFYRYGLNSQFHADVLDDIPSYLIPIRRISRHKLVCLINEMEVYRFQDKFFTKNAENECCFLSKNGNELQCHNYSCKKMRTLRYCAHKIAVLLQLTESERISVLEASDDRRARPIICSEVLRNQSKPSHGTNNPGRRGVTFSKNNGSRKIDAVIDRTSSFIDYAEETDE